VKNILITGFEPFGGEALNPSGELAHGLAGEVIADAKVVAVQLPCVFGAALNQLDEALLRVRPVLVLAVGQAGGRCDLSLERVAINVDDARIPDNAGAQPVDEPVAAALIGESAPDPGQVHLQVLAGRRRGQVVPQCLRQGGRRHHPVG
jgi:pyroglutamyl-peptidase